MGFLLFLLILGILIWYLSDRDAKKSQTRSWRETHLLQQRNYEWFSFIKGYSGVAKSAAEKKLITKMLDDIKAQGLISSAEQAEWSQQPETSTVSDAGYEMTPTAYAQSRIDQPGVVSNQAFSAIEPSSPKLDNITLLLYFGAFLFVSSVGLFVGLSTAHGLVKTILVLLVAVSLYYLGLWLSNNKAALKPAGLTFAGMGIAITPLVGVAAYNFLQYQAEAVWFATSLLCLGMYAHALFRIRKPLLNYIFMFTLLSLFESSVAIIEAPIYFFGWMLAVLGILLQVVSYNTKLWDDLKESSHVSSQLFLPLSIVVSSVIIPAQGFGQFGVTLLLAALYYALQAVRSSAHNAKQSNIIAAHVSLLAGIVSMTFSLSNDGILTGLILLGLVAAQSAGVWLFKEVTDFARNFAFVLMISGLVSVLFIFRNAGLLVATLLILCASTVLIWLKTRTSDSYILASLYWMILPFVFGLYFLKSVTTTNLALLVIASLVLQLLAFAIIKLRRPAYVGDSERGLVLVHIVVTLVTILFTSPAVAIAMFSLMAVILYCLSTVDKEDIAWPVISGLVVSFAVVRAFTDPLLYLAVLLALAYNILLAIRFRSDLNRWLSMVLWMLLPLGLGGLTSGNVWTPAQYAWMYVLITVCLLISRAIGRGAMFASSKVPLAKYARSASISYVIGYGVAATIAVFVSLAADNSQLHTSAITGVLLLLTCITAWYVEKQGDVLALVPALAQLGLISLMRPADNTNILAYFLGASSCMAVGMYIVSRRFVALTKSDRYITEQTTQVALLTAFIAPAWVFVYGDSTWPMPVSLALAGFTLLHYWRHMAQGFRESAVAIIVLAIMWAMGIAGISELQAYTHMVALAFAGFAAWRYVLSDIKTSDSYLYFMLAVATIPLTFQALAGLAGGLYGWWLLLEQVFFMLLGIAIKRRFVVMWGLSVAVASVLYQLRHLGYAALGFLALVVIGIAIYQLQKYNKPAN